jgi:hypothetical protein
VSAVDEIMQQIPLGQLAGQLGVDEQTAGAAAQQAIPALLGGLHANAQDPAGAASLESAIGNHSAGLIDGGVDLDQVDTGDGQKIVSNIFGAQQDGVTETLGGQLGGRSDLVQKLLPILAPIVMSYLAKRIGGGGGAGGLLGSLLGAASGGGGGTGGGVGDLLGGLLGGGHGDPQQPAAGGVLGALGGLLGGGRR